MVGFHKRLVAFVEQGVGHVDCDFDGGSAPRTAVNTVLALWTTFLWGT